MYTEGYDQWFKLNKNISAPLTELNQATTTMYKHMTEQHLELLGDNFTRLSDQLKRFTNARKPEDFINLQKECMNENITATIEGFQKILQTSMENFEEFTKLCNTFRDNTSSHRTDRHSRE